MSVAPPPANYDAIVLGAGAAGLFCAAMASRRGLRVAVLEHGPEPGRKILISGGGRANFTNLQVSAANYIAENPHFVKSALARFSSTDFVALVRRHRISYHEKTQGQLFCDTSARAIVDLLLNEGDAALTTLVTDCEIQSVHRDTRYRVVTSKGEFTAAALIVATGGLSIPKLGATDLGYRIARQFGVTVEEPYPALVPLTFTPSDVERWSTLAGVSTCVEIKGAGQRFTDKMLYTHRGLSGPAVLQLSSYWSRETARGTKTPVEVDLAPGLDVAAHVEERRAAGDKAAVRTLMAGVLPKRLCERWLEVEGFAMPQPSLPKLNTKLHRWRFTPSGTEGFAKAEVTGGGVSTHDLNSRTMEARNARGLFFVGEVVDVTGHLGGFNFQWAWSSAHAAAQAL